MQIGVKTFLLSSLLTCIFLIPTAASAQLADFVDLLREANQNLLDAQIGIEKATNILSTEAISSIQDKDTKQRADALEQIASNAGRLIRNADAKLSQAEQQIDMALDESERSHQDLPIEAIDVGNLRTEVSAAMAEVKLRFKTVQNLLADLRPSPSPITQTPGKENEFQLPSDISSLNRFSNTGNTGVERAQTVIGRLIKFLTGIIGTFAFVVLVYAGVLWMTSGGNADRERRAKEIMFWGVLGVVIIFTSYGILQFVLQNAF